MPTSRPRLLVGPGVCRLGGMRSPTIPTHRCSYASPRNILTAHGPAPPAPRLPAPSRAGGPGGGATSPSPATAAAPSNTGAGATATAPTAAKGGAGAAGGAAGGSSSGGAAGPNGSNGVNGRTVAGTSVKAGPSSPVSSLDGWWPTAGMAGLYMPDAPLPSGQGLPHRRTGGRAQRCGKGRVPGAGERRGCETG